MESENEEDAGVVSYKNKYHQLKSRLKYLIYEHECFENDIQKAQTKLLQLSRDKSFLLDQLMQYEAVVLSGGEETDYSSGEDTAQPLPSSETLKSENGSISERVEPPLKATPPPPSLRTPQLTKPGVTTKTTTTLLHSSATNTSSKTSAVKSGGVKKTTKPATKVSAIAEAKITKAVARARQNPQSTASSPLIVSLPLNSASLSGRSKQQQAPPTKHPPIGSLTSTAAILASIPVPPKQPSKTLPPVSSAPRPTGKGLTAALAAGGIRAAGPLQRASSSSSSSSSSDSEDSVSDSSSSSSSREEAMETGGPVPIVHSVPIPVGAPQLVRPKAIVSPVKAPPKLIPMGDPSSAPHTPLLSPLATSPQSQVTRFLWSNRTPSGEVPTTGFTSIAPLSSPTSLNKPSSGSAFQLVTSPPGSAPLSRPPSLQDVSTSETGRPHPPL